MKNEVIASYPIKCIGAAASDVKLDPNLSTVDVSLTVYRDGHRDVGCSLLFNGICQKFGINKFNVRCKHLIPEGYLDNHR